MGERESAFITIQTLQFTPADLILQKRIPKINRLESSDIIYEISRI